MMLEIAFCLWHKPNQLGYIAASEDANRRMAAGEKQRRCTICKRYLWPHEWGEE